MSLTKPQAILFDWDNTLVDTWPTIHAALNEMMRAMGREEWSLEYVKANVKKSMRDAFPEIFGDQWEEAAQHYQTAYRRMHLENLQPLEGALKVVEGLRASVPYVAIVSNKRGDTLRKELAHLKWQEHFDCAVGAGDAAHDKPHPEMVLHTLRQRDMGASKEIWFVGDTVVDLEVANASGCTPILYGDVATQGDSYLGHRFARHVRDHDALDTLIQSCL